MNIKFENKVKIKEVVDLIGFSDGILFTDGSTLTDYHDQDCCENVYADWDNVEDQLPIDILFDGFSVEIVPDSGFNLLLYPNIGNKDIYIRLFVPCYNSQNGYYSSNLDLIYNRNNAPEIVFDISDACEDDIC